MPRIQAVRPANASPQAAEILTGVKTKMGMIPNIVATMANSPAVANAYLGFSGALANGSLAPTLREQIALTVGESNQCYYCLSAHSAIGKKAGLSEHDVVQARQGTATNAKHAVALEFARKLVEQRANVTDEDVDRVRDAGFTDGEIGEIVAAVALNIFTNYFNHVADPEIDFPVAAQLATAV